MTAHLITVETPEAANTVAALVGRIGPGADAPTVVTLSPWAEYALERHRVPFRRLDEFHSVADREQLGDRTLRQVEAWTAGIDLHARSIVAAIGSTGLRPAYCWFFPLKILHDSVALRVFELRAMLRSLQPASVQYFSSARRQPGVGFDFMGESIYARLIPAVAAEMRIASESLGETTWITAIAGGPTAQPPDRLLRLAEAAPDLTRATLAALKGASRPRLLVDDWALARALARQGGCEVARWEPGGRSALRLGLPRYFRTRRPASAELPQVDAELRDLWQVVAADAAIIGSLREDGFDLAPVLRDRLEDVVVEGFRRDLHLYQTAQEVFRRCRSQAYLSSNLAWPQRRAVAQAARDLGLPVLAYDHGSEGYLHVPIDEHMDEFADIRLVYGEGVRRQALRRYPDGARPVTVGSVSLATLSHKTLSHKWASGRGREVFRRTRSDPQRSVVLFVPTLLGFNNRYLSHLVCSDSESFARERLVVEELAGRDDVQLIVKLHPALSYPVSPIAQMIADRGPGNCIVTRRPLAEFLPVADLFITDTPTTTLLEMLTTGKKVLVLHNQVMVFEKDALELLSKAVELTWTPAEFSRALHRIIESRDFTAPPEAVAEFLRQYAFDPAMRAPVARIATEVAAAVTV